MRTAIVTVLVVVVAAVWLSSPQVGAGSSSVQTDPDALGSWVTVAKAEIRPAGTIAQTVGTQFVFGTDERVRISPTTSFPWRAVAFVDFFDAYGISRYRCSASFIGPRLLLTAAHCLYGTVLGGYATDVAVFPGLDGDIAPYGGEYASAIWVPSGWRNGGSYDYDWGLILLPTATLGNAVGQFTIGVLRDQTLAATTFELRTAGYPGDKPLYTQWAAGAASFYGVQPTRLRSLMDIYRGQSGSPVWRNADRMVVGVVSTENSYGGIPMWNEFSRIDQRVLSGFLGACETAGCTFAYYVEPVTTATSTATATATSTSTATATVTRTPTAMSTPRPPTSTPAPYPYPAPQPYPAPNSTLYLPVMGFDYAR